MSSASTMRVCVLTAAFVTAQHGWAQDWPVKPVRVITSSAGSGTDFAARQIAPALSTALGQQVIIDNRPSGVVPGDVASKAAPDGYTFLVEGNNWLGALFTKYPYDTERDLLPVSMIARSPNVLIVHPSLPVKSVKELIALAKARPGELNFGSSRPGGGSHLSGILFRHLANVDIVWVRYRGSPQALAGLMGGEVHLQITDATNVIGHLKSGRVRGLGVTSKDESRLAPGLPPIAATLPGYDFVGTTGMFAPVKTPPAIVNRVNAEINRAVRAADFSERLIASGAEPIAGAPADFGAKIRSDTATWAKLIKELNIVAE